MPSSVADGMRYLSSIISHGSIFHRIARHPAGRTYSEASGSSASCPALHSLGYCLNPCAPWFATCCWVTVHSGGGDGRCRVVAAFLSVRQRRPRYYNSLQGLSARGGAAAATALHRRAAMYGECVLFGTKWNAEFN